MNLVATPLLEEKIRDAQLRDNCIKNIKENISNPKYKSFTIDDQGTVLFEGRIAVPKFRA